MPITVEFFGIARQHADCAQTVLETTDREKLTIGKLVVQLTEKYPPLADACFDQNQLRDGFILNINGQQFTRDVATMLNDGDSVLLMSTDAGG